MQGSDGVTHVFKSSFLPSSFGNAIASYPAASSASSEGDGRKGSKGKVAAGRVGSNGSSSKGKGASAGGSEITFANFDVLSKGRREFTAESYTIYGSLQNIADGFTTGELQGPEDDMDGYAGAGSMALRRDRHVQVVPQASQIAYYSRFMQLYRDCLSRYLLQLSSEEEIDTSELSSISAFRDTFHLAQILYVPADGRGDGIVSEELVDYLNTTNPWPSAERREALTSMAAPYQHADFWGFIYSCVLRGHTGLAMTVLETLLAQPSKVLQRLTQSCLDTLSTLPRSNSSSFAYESSFASALRQWRGRLAALLARLDIEMDEFQEEIEALEREADDGEDGDASMEACADERYDWQAGFKCLLLLLSGDTQTVLDASEDGWKSGLAAWCLLVRPALKRDDLPETIQAVTSSLPPDATLFKESMSVALLSGDIARALRLASEADTWLVTHLCDMFAKVGLLDDTASILPSRDMQEDAPGQNQKSFRDYFILLYCDLLQSDPGLWRVTVDYLASLDDADIGKGRMRELLVSLGSTASPALEGPPAHDASDAAANGEKVEGAAEDQSKTSSAAIKVEDVLAVCAQYGLEDATKRICLTTAENLISQQQYGAAVAYCMQGGDSRKINRICDLILDSYITTGVAALSFIDDLPTSLLHRGSIDGDEDDGFGIGSRTATLAASTSLSFLARYRDFHALYASGERAEAAALLVLLMSSNAAPKRFWCIMLVDAVALLSSPQLLVSEQDTFELMRCLSEIVMPVQKSGRDLYGHLEGLSRIAGVAETGRIGDGDKEVQQAEEREIEKTQAALRQLEVVRHALAQNLARCFSYQ